MTARRAIATALRALADRIDPPRTRSERSRYQRGLNLPDTSPLTSAIYGALLARDISLAAHCRRAGLDYARITETRYHWNKLGGLKPSRLPDLLALCRSLDIPEHLTDAATRPAAARSRSA